MVTKKHIITLSKKLIAIESVASNVPAQQACLDLLEAEFGNDFFVKRYVFKGHPAIVFSTSKRKKVDVIFSGHTDVVPGGRALFKPKIVGSKLYGRGSYDMKSGVVACLCATREYRAGGGTKDIAVLITSDEETSGYGTKMLLDKHKYHAEFAFIPDGGNDTGIVLKQKGFMQLKVRLQGKSAHSAYPWDGDNAIVKAFKLKNLVEKYFPAPTKREQWKTSVVLSRVETDNSLNQVPGSATVYFDIRYVDDSHPKKIIALLNKYDGSKTSVEVISKNNIFYSDEKNVYVQEFAEVVQEYGKKKVSFVRENGASDAVFFTEHNIPATLYRPKGGELHHDGEWIDVDSLYTMYLILVKFLQRL